MERCGVRKFKHATSKFELLMFYELFVKESLLGAVPLSVSHIL